MHAQLICSVVSELRAVSRLYSVTAVFSILCLYFTQKKANSLLAAITCQEPAKE